MKENKNNSSQMICPVCKSEEISSILEITQVPVHCNLLWTNPNDAVRAPRGDIQLAFCQKCGHIFNKAFKPELMKYTRVYENSLHFSPYFQDYAQSLAEYLIERYDLHGKDIIDIGCGKGDFLRILCRLGGNKGIGFDPTYVHDKNNALEKSEQIMFIKDIYSERYKDYRADFICCRQVLEHIQLPNVFLNNIRNSIGKNAKTILFFEVPNVAYTLRDLGIWDLIYEHCSYFSENSLPFLFHSCGFKVGDVWETFNGQYLCLHALPALKMERSFHPDEDAVQQMNSKVSTFRVKYLQKVEAWQDKLKNLKRKGQKAVIWGGGSKGVTFLNLIDSQKQIEYVIDINPRKQGNYTAGSGQKIVSPEFLREYNADTIIIMNPIYQDEIKKITKGIGREDINFICA